MQIAQDLAATEQVAHPMTDQPQIERLGNEIRGAGVKRPFDRLRIVHPGHHDDRQFIADRLAQAETNLEAVETGHVDIQHDDIAGLLHKLAQGIFAIHRLHNVKPGLFQRRFQYQTGRQLVISDENTQCGNTHACPFRYKPRFSIPDDF